MVKYFAIGDAMSSKDILQMMVKEQHTELDIEELVKISFFMYKMQKKKYHSYDFVPLNLIKLYYSTDNNHSDFSHIISNFKKRYIDQESKLENIHTVEEINGLGLVYDYIRSDEWKKCANIYIIMVINLKLFSLTPYPEAAGKFRNADCFLKDSGLNTCPYNQIDTEIVKLYPIFENLIKLGDFLSHENNESNEDKIIKYIDDCIKLKCRLIEIHPFFDGNGRTMRAMMNLLFKIAGLPPVYVRLSERNQYLYAMNKAINEKDYTYINKFYYFKICDSILELDVNQRIKNKENNRILIRKNPNKMDE